MQKLNLIDIMKVFIATFLYPSTMWAENSVYPKIETGFVFKPHMIENCVDAFNNQTFNQDGSESGILRTKYYNTYDLIFQCLPNEEKGKKIEVN